MRRALPLFVFAGLIACNIVLGLDEDLPVRGEETTPLDDGGPENHATDAAAEASAIDAASDATPAVALSCEGRSGPGVTDCGPNHDENCCVSGLVEGGSFKRSNDATYPARVSSFRLDRFEVTVGRFRAFVEATSSGSGGFKPPTGSGKHVHLNDGRGVIANTGGFEVGWENAWNGLVAATKAQWDSNLACAAEATWTPAATPNDRRSLNCVSWYEAYAFCIWDGAFLPTEAEWNYAAAAGSEQRSYPWGTPLDCAHANYGASNPGCEDAGVVFGGSRSPTGDGKWGQADLVGNVQEWALDLAKIQYTNPCDDCTATDPSNTRIFRGGAFVTGAAGSTSNNRNSLSAPDGHSKSLGVRCARAL